MTDFRAQLVQWVQRWLVDSDGEAVAEERQVVVVVIGG